MGTLTNLFVLTVTVITATLGKAIGFCVFNCDNNPPEPIEHPTVKCPNGVCTWVPNATFSCPQAGCNALPVGLGDSVEQILLTSNDVSIIPKLNYTNMKLLDLADNKIHTITDNAFMECKSLITLILSHNKITTLEINHLAGLDKLKYLYLQGNSLTVVPNILYSDVHELERLDLSRNEIHTIEDNAFAGLSKLKYLHLYENRISELKWEHLWDVNNLEYMELMENKLHTIYSDAFHELDNLVHLDLSFNNISVVEDNAFSALKKLKRLSMEHNNLKSLDSETFRGLTGLEELYLGYNYMTDIEEGVFPDTIMKLSLVFSHQLRTLKNGSLSGMPKLNEVYISSCHNLQQIEVGAFSDDPRIEVLDLSNNHLQTLSQDLLEWKKLVYLDLRCDTPLSVRGKFLSSLHYDEFRCGDYNVNFHRALATALILFFTMLLLMTLILFLYKCRHKVFPCCYDRVVGKYRAMYNTVEAEDVHFEKPPSSAQDVGDVDFEKPNSNGQDIEVRVEKPTYENRYA